MSEPIYIELAVRQCESGTASVTAQKAVAARFRERTSKLAKATERIVALGNEIARLREERKPVGWCVQAAAVLIQVKDEAEAKMLSAVYGYKVLAIVEADAKEEHNVPIQK